MRELPYPLYLIERHSSENPLAVMLSDGNRYSALFSSIAKSERFIATHVEFQGHLLYRSEIQEKKALLERIGDEDLPIAIDPDSGAPENLWSINDIRS